MAKDNRIDIEINAKGGASLKKSTKEIKQQKKQLDNLSGSGKKLDKQQQKVIKETMGIRPEIITKEKNKLMPHALDKETVKRILHLHKVQGLSAAIIAQRFGYSAAWIYNVIRRKATSNKQQAASVKQQANHSITVTGSHSTSNKLLTK